MNIVDLDLVEEYEKKHWYPSLDVVRDMRLELAAARACVSYTRMLVKALEEGRSTTNKLAQTAASLQAYDKVRGKGEGT